MKLIPLTLTFVFNSGVKSKDRKVFSRMIDSLQLIYNYFRSNTVNCTSILYYSLLYSEDHLEDRKDYGKKDIQVFMSFNLTSRNKGVS